MEDFDIIETCDKLFPTSRHLFYALRQINREKAKEIEQGGSHSLEQLENPEAVSNRMLAALGRKATPKMICSGCIGRLVKAIESDFFRKISKDDMKALCKILNATNRNTLHLCEGYNGPELTYNEDEIEQTYWKING